MIRIPQAGAARNLAVATASALVAVALTGCGGDGADDGITFWLSSSSAQLTGYQDLAQRFEADEGVHVEIVNVPYDEYTEKLTQAAQAGSLPDVGSVPSLNPLWMDQLQDLTPIVEDASNRIDTDLVVADDDGRYLYIPSDVTAAGLFLNVSLFDEAGVDHPTDPEDTWTWDEFLAAAGEVRTATGAKYDLVYDASAARIRSYLYTNGASGFQLGDDGRYTADAATVEALADFAALNDDVVMPRSVWASGADPSAMFKSGQVVAYYSGVWQVSDFSESITDFTWAAAPTPAQPVHATDINIGGDVVAFDNDGTAEDALRFVEYLFEPENYTQVAESNGFLPVETGLSLDYPFTDAAAQDAFALYVAEMELADPISTSGQRAQVTLTMSGAPEITDPTKDEVAKLVNGQQDAAATVRAVLDGLNERLG